MARKQGILKKSVRFFFFHMVSKQLREYIMPMSLEWPLPCLCALDPEITNSGKDWQTLSTHSPEWIPLAVLCLCTGLRSSAFGKIMPRGI